MKHCPTCNRTFDDTKVFCGLDGTRLVGDAPTPSAGQQYNPPTAQAAPVAPVMPAAPAAPPATPHVEHPRAAQASAADPLERDRKSTRLNSSHVSISYAVLCLKKKFCVLAD